MKQKLLLTLVLLTAALTAAAADNFEVDGLIYREILINKVEVAGFSSDAYCDSIVIPETVTYDGNTYTVTAIGQSAFRGRNGLMSVTIPKTITSIRNYAFCNCPDLTSITVKSDNPKFDSRDNCNAIIETESNTLIAGCKNTVIPNTVTTIGSYAFWDCSGLTNIIIPNSVINIERSAFEQCDSLTAVDIPNSVTTIGAFAFYWCFNLKSVTIGNSVTLIGNKAFESCIKLKSLTIPNSVTTIGACAFMLSGLKSVIIGESVKTIGNSAFRYCDGLTSVRIPNSVTDIGTTAFADCNYLKSVIIGNSVTSIGDRAFNLCYQLVNVTSLALDAPAINSDTFYSRTYYGTLCVPYASLSTYKEMDYWKDFANIIPIGDLNGDGHLSVSDVAKFVDMILTDSVSIEEYPYADVNGDGRISIGDISALIQLILYE